MTLFNRRNKNKSEVPAEVQEYYQAERRDRTGIAWLLAIGTLIVTILLATGIFFAGRWAYRKIAGNDGQNTASQSEQHQGDEQQEGQRPEENSDQSAEERERSDQEAQEAEERRNEAEEEQRAQAERERNAREEAERRRENAQTPSTLPSGDSGAGTGDRQASGRDNIPETGPGDTLAIFVAVTVLGYMAHRVHFAQKSK